MRAPPPRAPRYASAMTRPRSLRLPSRVAIACAIAVIVGVLLPWYQTALGPVGAPGTLSGWDATAWAKLAVAGAALCLLCSAAVALDIRQAIALHGPVRRILAGIALAGTVLACVGVLYRFAVPPDPALDVTREIGIFLASLAAIGALWGASAQFSRTFPERRRRRRSRAHGRRGPRAQTAR